MDTKKTLTKRERAIERVNARKRKQKKLLMILVPIIAVLLIGAIVGIVVAALKDDAPRAEIVIKDYGKVVIRLDKENAPKTVERFIKLANEGFYNEMPFYSIVDGKIFSGDPTASGEGGYSSSIFGEFSDNGYENNLSHTRGVISFDREIDYNSGTSRFFILTKDHTELDGSYASFGAVKKGLDIIDEIINKIQANENGLISEEEQPIIESIVIKQ